MQLVDTHLHLDDEQFDEIRDDVVQRAMEAGVTQLIAVGTTAASSRLVCELADRYANVYAAIGVQPNYVAEASSADWQTIQQLASHPKVVAIGETGLDRYWDHSPFDDQLEWFQRHLQLARETARPFIVHMRDCQVDVLEALRRERQRGPLKGVMHSFTGDAEGAAEFVALGMHLSFAGMVTYKKSDELRQIARATPADRLLVETDAPYLSPHPHRGTRPNEPALLVHTVSCLAEVRGCSIVELARQTTANATRLFGLPSRNE